MKQGGSDVREMAKVLESKDRMIADYQRQIEELKRNTSKGNAIAIAIAVSFTVATTRIICVFFLVLINIYLFVFLFFFFFFSFRRSTEGQRNSQYHPARHQHPPFGL